MPLVPPRSCVPGRCRFCRCTDLHACDEGCEWIDAAHTVCSNPVCMRRYILYLERRVRSLVKKPRKLIKMPARRRRGDRRVKPQKAA